MNAAISGLKTAAQIAGLLVQRQEIGDAGAFARMTDDELDDALVAQAKAIGLSEKAIREIRSKPKLTFS